MITRICQNCGEEFKAWPFKAKCGEAKYCSRKCYWTTKKKTITKTCLFCQKEFGTIHSYIKKGGGKYCSLKCSGLAHQKKIIKECLYCGKEFKTTSSRIRNNKGKYCTVKCCRLASNKSIIKKCLFCGKEFFVEPNIIEIGKGKYCSLDCYNMIKKLNWQDLEYKEKKLKQMNSKQHNFPNKPETIINSFLTNLYPHEWKYVGNGEVWYGGKNPDFMNVNGQKKLIEVFGDYWHKGEDPEDRINHFRQYGFETLVIWEKEILKNHFENKINSFMKGEG